jgi:hypothetical protein
MAAMSEVVKTGCLVLGLLASISGVVAAQQASELNDTRAESASQETTPDVPAAADFVLIHGAAGEEEYEQVFDQTVANWREIASQLPAALSYIGPSSESDVTAYDRLKQTLEQFAAEPMDRPLWIVFVGHGTFFNDTAKLNLVGPDVTARELATWLDRLHRPIVFVHGGSSSGIFVERLSQSGRVIVTATRSGTEVNYARFGLFLSEACREEQSDLDHDGAVSLLEAFLAAARATEAFYERESRLATEHALLDDNGDKLGTTADFFQGIHVVNPSSGTNQVDGVTAHQWIVHQMRPAEALPEELRKRRDELEQDLARLRTRRSTLSDDEYFQLLEPFLVELAQLYEQPSE